MSAQKGRRKSDYKGERRAMSLRLPEELHTKLTSLSDKEGLSMATLIEFAIEDFLSQIEN